MDRIPPFSSADRHAHPSSRAPPPPVYQQPFPASAAPPPPQYPFDPFQSSRDPFLTRGHGRSDSLGQPARAWPSPQGNSIPNGQHRRPSPHNQTRPFHPPPPTNGVGPMSYPQDPARPRSVGASGSAPQHGHASSDPLPPPPQYSSRHMLPPSPSQASSLPGSAPRGPPTASPFAGARDLASHTSSRPSGGMSISSLLGGNEERRPHGSPHASTPKSMPPPSPARARSSSMREVLERPSRDNSPPRALITEPRAASAAFGHDRSVSEHRREALFAPPPFASESINNFRTFHQGSPESRPGLNGHGPPGRPSSQPIEQQPSYRPGEVMSREPSDGGRFGAFRTFGEAQRPALHNDGTSRQESGGFPNGHGPNPPSPEHGHFNSPHLQHERPRPDFSRFPPIAHGTPMREEQTGLFRPAYQPTSEPPRHTTEPRPFHDPRHDIARSSPPASDYASFDRHRDRPMTFEEHQRMDYLQREPLRKESDGVLHRSVLNLSPDINRKGRNSPLPQAVQGAQPRHIGPGGDNPGVKMEFGRMFSGLGSGVGTVTPTGTHGNGTTTPSRLTPMRQVQGGDLVRTAVAEIEEGRRNGKVDGRKKNGRRAREDEEHMNGRETPDNVPGSKRAKTNPTTQHHHHHHLHPRHHHHHHQPTDSMPNPFNTIRFPSNPPAQQAAASTNAHVHGPHAHAVQHHHHHAARPVPARKPTTTVMSRRLVEECAKKPRSHLGSQVYKSDPSVPRLDTIDSHARVKYHNSMAPIPYFEGKENCTYTVRVPRDYVAHQTSGDQGSSYLEEICNHRQVWGTDVYTDDSDVVAAAVHSGWLKGDFGDFNDDLRELEAPPHEDGEAPPQEIGEAADATPPHSLTIRPRKPVSPPSNRDTHITLLLLPPLEHYASTTQHHLRSREWAGNHDGMSFMIYRIDFVDEAPGNRFRERGAKMRKARIGVEEGKRRDAAARGLLMFASSAGSEAPVGAITVGVGA